MEKNIRRVLYFMAMIVVFHRGTDVSFAAPAPPVPGDSEVLSEVFRNPIGTGPELKTEKILQLTPAKNSQRGAIWSKDKIDLMKDFEISAYLYLGDSQSRAADGITFTLQNDSRMETALETKVLGDAGMGLGAYSNKSRGEYVRNAISVEFDTYYNSGTRDSMDREIGSNGDKGHIAVVTPKSNNNNPSGEHSGVILAPNYLSNGTWRRVTFIWQADTQTLSYDLEGVGANSYQIPNLVTQFGGSEVYWGFTASTGGYNAENLIAITELPQKIASEATVENKTTQIGPGLQVEAVRGDYIELAATIQTSGFVDPAIYDSSTMEVAMPEGVTPNLEKVMVDNQKVPAENLSFEAGKLTVKQMNLSDTGTTVITVEAEITSKVGEVILESDFTLKDINDVVLSVTNQVTIEIPPIKMGTVTIHYVDMNDQPLQENDVLTGPVGEEYEAVAPEFNGYELSETEGEAKGKFTEDDQTIIFRYKMLQFHLKQSVHKLNGAEALTASAEEVLVYTVTLESLYKDQTSDAMYQTVSIRQPLPKYLGNISDLTLMTKDKRAVGTVHYDEASHSVIGALGEKDQVGRSENLILSYRARIDEETVEGTEIKVKAEAEATYNDNQTSDTVQSNEVITTVEGIVYLASAPQAIDFGSIMYDAMVQRVDDGTYDRDLIVKDTRLHKTQWALGVKLIDQMTKTDDEQAQLVDAIQYMYGEETYILSDKLQVIYQQEESAGNAANIINISDTWGKTSQSNGIKLVVDPSKSKVLEGQYRGEMEWQLIEGIP